MLSAGTKHPPAFFEDDQNLIEITDAFDVRWVLST